MATNGGRVHLMVTGVEQDGPAGQASVRAAKLLSQIVESTSDCIISFDRQWRFTFVNGRAAEELLPPALLVGRNVLEAYPQLTETPFWPAYEAVMQTGVPRRLEGFMPGLNSWYEVYAAPTDDGITVFFRNIDARKAGEEDLRHREAHFRKALNNIPQMVWITLPDGSHDYFNRPWYDFTGVPEGSTDGDAWNDMFHPDDQERAWEVWRASLATGKPYEIEYRLKHSSGDYRWVLGQASPERDENNQIVRWYGTCTDIHDRICAQHELHENRAFQESVLESSADCIKVLTVDGRLDYMNGPGCRAMELDSFDKIRGKVWSALWPKGGRESAQQAVAEAVSGCTSRFTGLFPTAKGKAKWWDVVTSPVMNEAGEVVRLLSISRDVTALRETSHQLKRASEHDALTSLPNRRAFQAHLQAAILRAMEKGSSTGLLLLDLDHFKHVNDTMGHAAGDHLLRVFADRLTASTRGEDFVARLGGDEFAVILEDVKTENQLVEIGTSVLSRLKDPVRFDGRVISGSASIGGALFPRDGNTADDLFKNADTALYSLKTAGRGGTKMFHNHMRQEAQKIASQLNLARIVVTQDNVVPHYQSKSKLSTGEVAGFEALLRWQHPTRGMQDPETVEEAFKDYELASKIGELMQSKVLTDIRSWRARGLDVRRISLNASPAEFLRDDFSEQFLARLRSYNVPPTLIEVEVTEHVFLDQTASYVARALQQLKGAGVTIALDDFGTGYSSLSHLRDFPVDVVKIDRSFVAQMLDDPEIAAIVRAVVDLAHSLSIEVVAEGVETVDQLALLKVMGCDFGQGWHFGKAAPAADVVQFLYGGAGVRHVAA